MLTLYYLPVCPSCRSVLMLARELDIPLQLKYVSLPDKEHMTPEFLAMNPGHTVPVLVDHETNLTLFESRAIMSYIVDKYAPDNSMYPANLVKRAHIHKWLYFNSGTLYPSGRPLVKPILNGKEPAPDARPQLHDTLMVTEAMIALQGTKYLTGDKMTIADLDLLITIDFPAVLASVDLTPYPKLNQWFNMMTAEVESYDEISGQKVRKLKEKLDQDKAQN